MQKIMMILLILIAPAAVACQDTEDLVDQLKSPIESERILAAQMLSEIFTVKDYIDLYDDDISAFWELSAAGLPKDEKLDNLLLSSDDPDSAAEALFLSSRMDLLDGAYSKTRERLREYWYDDWAFRVNWDAGNGELVRFFQKRDWARTLLYNRNPWPPRNRPWQIATFREIVSALCGDGPDVSKFAWARALRACVKSGRNELLKLKFETGTDHWDGLASKVSSDLYDEVSYAELICLALDKPDWLLAIQPNLEKATRYMVTFAENGAPRIAPARSDERTPIVRMAALAATLEISKFESELAAYNRGKPPFSITEANILGSDWFFTATASEEFCAWFNENVKPSSLKEIDRLKIFPENP